MVLYTCQRCGYQNKIKSHFTKHLNRKTQCNVKKLSDDKCSRENKSYIDPKNGSQMENITFNDFDLKSKSGDLDNSHKSYIESASNRSQIDFGTNNLTSKRSQIDFELYPSDFKSKSNAKVIQNHSKKMPLGQNILPSVDNFSNYPPSIENFINLAPTKNIDNKYECPYCGAVYGRKNNCTQHLKNKCKVRKSKLLMSIIETSDDNESYGEKSVNEPSEKSYKKVIYPKSKLTTVDEKKLYTQGVSEKTTNDNVNYLSCEKSYIGELYNDSNNYLDICSNENFKVVVMESEMLKKENDELRKQVEMLISKVGHTTVNLQQNIIINNIGKEDISYIGCELVNKLVNAPYIAIPKLLENIHFHPDHPENHNIRITNKKERYVKVFKDNKWTLEDKNVVIENMVDKSKSILDEHRDETLHSAFKNKCYDHFSQQLENGEKDLVRKINKDIALLVINNSNK